MNVVAKSAEPQVFRSCQFTMDEINIASADLRACAAAVKTLYDAFESRDMAEIRRAAEHVKAYAEKATTSAHQIVALSSTMASVFATHINRRGQS